MNGLFYTILLLVIISIIAEVVLYMKLDKLMKDPDIYNPKTKQWINNSYAVAQKIQYVLLYVIPVFIIILGVMGYQQNKKRPMQFMFI